MKKIILALCFLATGCGYEARDSELTGQVKKVVHRTPILCSDWTYVDVSLGVMRNGVGSMSTEDVGMTVNSEELAKTLKTASSSGALVKITYDQKRVALCREERVVTGVELVK